jgi:Domain of unknown function (DUF2382)/PRC-barrel domain
MSVPDIDTAMAWRGRTVRDENGDELGRLTELYLDSETSRPAWAGVKRGRLRGTATIVPLAGAEEIEGDLRLPHHRRTFDDAPDVDPDVQLTEQEEAVLRDHWGRGWAPPSGEETDTAMTRSEEEVSIGKKPVRRAERVRLKKVLVEDEVTRTVPVRREEIRLETDPPPEGRIESVEDVDQDSRS